MHITGNQKKVKKVHSGVQQIFASFASFTVKFRIPIILLFIALMIFSGFGLTKLRTTVSIDSFFLPDDPLVAERAEFESIFANNDFIGVLVESDDVFSVPVLQMMHDLSERIKADVPYVASIVSIPDTSPVLLGGMSIPFVDGTLSMQQSEIEELRSSFDARRSLRSVLYTKDYTQAWILVRLEDYPDVWESENEPSMYTGRKMMEVLENFHSDDYKLIPTGIPVMAYRKSKEMMQDLVRILMIAGIAALICILFIIRMPMGVFGSLVMIVGSLTAVFGGLGWLKITADTTFMLVPMLLTIAVTVGYTIHVTNFFKRGLNQTGNRKEAVMYAFSETGWPVLFTAFTTIVSLLSFLFVSIYPIRWVGVVSAVSIATVFIFIMMLYGALLSIGPDKTNNSDDGISLDGTDLVFEKMGRFFVKNGKITIIVSVVLLAVSLVFASTLKVNLNTNKMMGNKLPHMKDQMYIANTEIGAIYSYDIAILFSDKNQALTLENMKKMEQLEQFAQQSPLITGTKSIVESLKEFNSIRYNDVLRYELPPNDAGLRGLVSFYSRIPGNDLAMWLTDDKQGIRMTAKVKEFSSLEISEHIENLKAELYTLFPKEQYAGIKILVTGSVIQTAAMNQYVTKGLVVSVCVALAAIAIIMIIAFRSIRVGLIAMIPNVAPIITVAGLMGIFKIELEFVTMTIAPMLLGLAVDDTIHLVTHFKTVFGRSRSYETATSETFRSVGKSVIQTTLILSVTFFIFAFSRVQSMVNLGLFTMAGIISALAADIMITPVLLNMLKPFGKTTQSGTMLPEENGTGNISIFR